VRPSHNAIAGLGVSGGVATTGCGGAGAASAGAAGASRPPPASSQPGAVARSFDEASPGRAPLLSPAGADSAASARGGGGVLAATLALLRELDVRDLERVAACARDLLAQRRP